MMIGANLVPLTADVVIALLAMFAVGALSIAVFVILSLRWTSGRPWIEIQDWARTHDFSARQHGGVAVPPFDALPVPLHVRICISDEKVTVLRAQNASDDATRWHLLVREVESQWPATGLRPALARISALDIFSLSSFPLIGEPQRFVVYGTDSAAARRLGNSPLRSLLPSDVGLLLHGNRLVLDFSTRPFDPLEFDRMIGLADQLVAHLPSTK